MDFIEVLRQKIAALRAERDATHQQLEELLAPAEAEVRDLTAEEDARFNELREQLVKLDGEIADADARATELEGIRSRTEAVERVTRPAVAVRREPDVYRRHGEHSFLADLYARTFRTGDVTGAEQRLAAHQAEMERRDIGVSAVGGLVPPTYLTDDFAPLARAGRPFLQAIGSRPLPPNGTSFVIPRVTTGSAAAQTSEGSGWNEQDVAVTDLTVSVQLTTAQQDISRTLFERGGAVVDQVLFPDLLAAVEVVLDNQAINGSGTAPQHRGVLNVSGINAVTYTDASPTVAEFLPKLADAIQRINSNRHQPADLIVMHPRRWAWIVSGVDTANRPLVLPAVNGPQNAQGVGDLAAVGQVGQLLGVPVVVDANIPTNLGAGTNEDIVIVARSSDLILWESPTLQFTLEQALSTAPGQVRVAVGRFALFAAGRYPAGISTVGGTGLITPSF